MVLGGRGAVLGGRGDASYRWARAIDLIYRIEMVVARASGTLIASSSEQNKFWTLKLRRAGGVRAGRGATGGPGTGGHGGLRDGGTRGARDGGTRWAPG